jgi:hypothetical protein
MAAPTPVQRTLSDSKERSVRLITIPPGGDADVGDTVVVDTSALTEGATGTTHAIERVRWSLHGFAVRLLFDATSDVHVLTLTGTGDMDFRDISPYGLTNNAGAGITGDIIMVTQGIDAADDDNDDNAGFFIIETRKIV